MKEAIIIFTRVPIKGRTKTRLEGCLSRENCALLHKSFIKDIYNTCLKVKKDIFIFCTPYESVDILQDILGEYPIYYPQTGDNLGDKMYNSINNILNKGYDSCILIGTDVPLIKEEYLLNAFSSLHTSDVVFGPTLDKGYYLVGMKKPNGDIFNIEAYGSGDVLSSTLENVEKLGLTYSLVETTFDIDEEEDLLMLVEGINSEVISNCFYTREFLKKYWRGVNCIELKD